jgi:hypothetical protein
MIRLMIRLMIIKKRLGAKPSTMIGYRYLRFRPKLLYYSDNFYERP